MGGKVGSWPPYFASTHLHNSGSTHQTLVLTRGCTINKRCARPSYYSSFQVKSTSGQVGQVVAAWRPRTGPLEHLRTGRCGRCQMPARTRRAVIHDDSSDEDMCAIDPDEAEWEVESIVGCSP